MKKDTFTPGPWTAKDEKGHCADTDWRVHSDEEDSWSAAPVVDVDGEAICLVVQADPSDEPMDSNARLIAAAPDLLAALRECVAKLDSDHYDDRWPHDAWVLRQRCKAAIRKATEPEA
jgi:hypothetical protein